MTPKFLQILMPQDAFQGALQYNSKEVTKKAKRDRKGVNFMFLLLILN